MANEAYFSDDFTTLDLETDEATPVSTPVAGIQGVTIEGNFTIEQLYTADSTKIEAQKQSEASVNVTIEWSKWDPVVAQEWLDGSTSDATATSLADTTDPQKYSLSATFTSTEGTTYDITVTGITFETMPLVDASRGEFIQWSLEGTGEDITSVTTA